MEECDEIYSWMKFERILPEYFVDERAEGLYGRYRNYKPKKDLQEKEKLTPRPDVGKLMRGVEEVVRRDFCKQPHDITDNEDV